MLTPWRWWDAHCMSLRIDQWNVEFRPWGWVRLREASDGGSTVYLQYQLTGPRDQERFDLREVVVRAAGSGELSTRVFRRIPFSQIEQSLNATLVRFTFDAREVVNLSGEPVSEAQIEEAMARAEAEARDAFVSGAGVEPPSLDALDDYFDATEGLVPMHSLPVPSGMLISDGTGDLPPGRIPRLEPPGGRLTDDFLRDVADAYRWAASVESAPAPALAKIADVPVRTVHRWVYEARKRGILPPARSGRAG